MTYSSVHSHCIVITNKSTKKPHIKPIENPIKRQMSIIKVLSSLLMQL